MSLHDESVHRRGHFSVMLAGFLAIAAFFLLSEHRAHALGALPLLLLLLLCPLLHFIGHDGHGAQQMQPRRGEGNEH